MALSLGYKKMGVWRRDNQNPKLARSDSKIHYVKNTIQHLKLVLDEELDGIVDDPIIVSYRSSRYATGKALASCSIVASAAPVSLGFSKKSAPIQIIERVFAITQVG